jgi:drug/metabolite transporter (DMT)-like permease
MEKVVSLTPPNGSAAGTKFAESHHRQFIMRPPRSLSDRIIRTEEGGNGSARNADELPKNVPPTRSGIHRTGAGVGIARASLLAVAWLFGTLNVCLRLVYALPDPPAPPVVGLIRGVFTALCFAPSLSRLILHRRNSSNSSCNSKGDADGLWSAAFWLGLWNVASQGMLTVGLTMTSSSVRASFLAQSSVVITPLISLLGGQAVKPSVWWGSLVAIVGLLILCDVGNGNDNGVSESNAGDLLVLGCALCWSMYLFQFGRIAHRYDKVSLQSATTAIRALMYVAWFLIAALILRTKEESQGLSETMQSMWLGWQDLRAWGLLLFSAVGSGAIAGILQQKGQATLSASEANIILSSEPIWAGFCAWLILGELLSPRENVGGLVIFFAAVVATGALDGLLSISKINARRKLKDSSHPGEL